MHYATLFFDLCRFGCCEEASEFSVGFDVLDIVVSFWPMLAAVASCSSSSSFFSPLLAASSDSAIWERKASLFAAASDSNNGVVIVLEPAAEAQCIVGIAGVPVDDENFIVGSLCHRVCVVFSFSCRSCSRYDNGVVEL